MRYLEPEVEAAVYLAGRKGYNLVSYRETAVDGSVSQLVFPMTVEGFQEAEDYYYPLREMYRTDSRTLGFKRVKIEIGFTREDGKFWSEVHESI